MRHVPKARVQASLPNGWEDRAQQATDDVRPLPPAERRARIDAKRALWAELRGPFKDLMGGKCWYCESNQCRTDNPIDHFRPKGGVAECETHGGYWWLAFDWENYRYCCDYCNSYGSPATRGTPGGKQNNFPLWDENRRAMTEADDLDQEQPLLLDPLSAADPGLLWFNEDGSTSPNPRTCGNDPLQYLHKRASESIRLYHLEQEDIKERRADLCRAIKKLIVEADKMFLRYAGGDQTARGAYSEKIELLRSWTKEDADYSMTAVSTLKGLRANSVAAEAVLEAG